MSSNSYKIRGSIVVLPKASPTLTDNGEIAYDATSNDFLARWNGVTVTLANLSSDQTFSNKTLALDTNIIVAATTNRVALFDDSGNLATSSISTTILNYLSNLSSDVQAQLDAKASDSNLTDHINDASGAHAASAISVTTITGLTATDVQAAIAEHQGDIDTINSNVTQNTSDIASIGLDLGTKANQADLNGLQNDLTAHIEDTSDAHDASAISVSTVTNLDAADVQAAIAEHQSDIDTLTADVATNAANIATNTSDIADNTAAISSKANQSDLTGHIITTVGAHGISDPDQLVYINDIQTLQGKTFSDPIQITDQAVTPAAPSAGVTKIYSKTDGKVYKLTSSGAEEEIGTGSGGGINYISTSTFDSDWGNWNLFADGASLVDGTGGTPTATFTQDTSAPLRGNASGAYTPGALGDGVSINFTVDKADLGELLSIEFDYQADGQIDEGDYEVWIYDIVNSQLIQPSGYSMPSGIAGVNYRFQGLFQVPVITGSTPDFRLIIFQKVASTSGLLIDNVSVGPQVKTYGVPVTDPVEWTPTFTGFGTVSNVDATSWRIGKYLFFDVRLTAGTTTATEARMSLGFNGADGNVTIDPDAFNAATIKLVGKGNNSTSSTTSFSGKTVLAEPGKAYVTFGIETSTSAGLTKQNGSDAFATGVAFHFFGHVPIQGWSSNTLMSSSADTRVVGFRATSDSGAALPTADGTIYVYEDVEDDTHGAYNSSTGVYTVRVPGRHKVIASIASATGTYASGNLLKVAIYHNGVSKKEKWVRFDSATSNTFSVEVSDEFDCEAGDTIDIRPVKSGTAVNALSTSVANVFSVSRISGPSQIAASETIAVEASRSSSQSIANNSATVVQFNTVEDDTHGSIDVTTNVGRVTIKEPGRYRIAASVEFAGNSTGRRAVNVNKNGSFKRQLFAGAAGTASAITFGNSTTLRLVAGDYIEIAAFQDSGGALNVGTSGSAYTHLSIERIGL